MRAFHRLGGGHGERIHEILVLIQRDPLGYVGLARELRAERFRRNRMADTRKDKRAPVSLKVRFKSATVDEFIEHYCKDVSRGGIFIKSSQPMPVGTLLKFQFQLKDESQLIKGVGRVVWTRSEDRAGPDRPSGMGIKFIKMDNESRVMVERIINSSEGSVGAFEDGRGPGASVDSDLPPKDTGKDEGGGGFFPDLGPAELPPPEDRTAVRQAAEFLAAALSEVSDEAAAREAEQKAEEARKRTKEIDAQRVADAEKQRKPAAVSEALPSMIIDPALSVPPPTTAERTSDVTPKPAPALEQETAKASKKPSLPPPPKAATEAAAPRAASQPPAASTLPTLHGESRPPLPEKKSPVLPIIAIAAVLGVAAYMGLRGGPEGGEKPAAAVDAPKPAPVAPAEPAPAPTPEPVVEPLPAPEPTAEPTPEVAPAPPAEVVQIRVSTQPAGAEISVAGSVKGVAPVTFDLEKGVAANITATLPTFASASQEITPESAKTVRFALKALPYVLHVESTPPGATVLVAGKRGTAPVDLTWPVPPKTALKASAKLAGHDPADTAVALDAFTQSEDAMRASVVLTLNPSPEKPVVAPAPVAPKPRPARPAVVAPAAPSAADNPSEPAAAPKEEPKADEPKPEPAPAPKVEEPKPEPAPAPKEEPKPEPKPETLPDNPFG
jgi:uncharacterized protein (TIGR02266 family)